MLKCPLCDMEISVMAVGDDDALVKMMSASRQHLVEMHKETELMEDAEMEKIIKGGWKKMM